VERKRSKDIIDRLNPLQRSLNSDWMTQQADLSYEVSASVKPVSLAHQPTESLVSCVLPYYSLINSRWTNHVTFNFEIYLKYFFDKMLLKCN